MMGLPDILARGGPKHCREGVELNFVPRPHPLARRRAQVKRSQNAEVATVPLGGRVVPIERKDSNLKKLITKIIKWKRVFLKT